jgi:hypothetical protein
MSAQPIPSQRAIEESAIVREWRGTECPCGVKKESRKFLCVTCYYSLPEKLRGNLFGIRLDDPDFFTAYRDAVVWLNALGRIKRKP